VMSHPGRWSSFAHGSMWQLSGSTAVVGIAILAAVLFGWALAEERWTSLTILLLVMSLPVFARWPIVSTFGLYAFLLPFDTVQAAYGSMAFTRPLGILAAVVLTAAAVIERRLRRPPLSALWFGLLVLWCAICALWALDSDAVFRRLPSLVSLFVVYFVAVTIIPTRREFYAVSILTVIGGASGAVLAYLYGLEYQGRMTLTVADRVANPNSFAGALILPLALGLAGVVGIRAILNRAMALGAVCLIAMGMYVSASRGAVLAGIVTVVVFVCRIGIKRDVVATVVVLSVLALTVSEPLVDRVNLLITGEDTTGSGRLDIWRTGLQAVERFGVFGAGLDNFPTVYRNYAPLGPRLVGPGAHNTYLMVLVELGVFGLALLLGVIAGHLLVLRRARKEGRGGFPAIALEAACLGVLTFSMFGDEVWTKPFWLPWVLLTWATYFREEPYELSVERVDPHPAHVDVTAVIHGQR
jgi:O-antigen ligase